MNHASSHFRSSRESSAGSHTSMPASRSRPRSSRHTRCCSASSDSARILISASCWAGVRPSGETAVRPAFAWPIRPATRDGIELVQVGRADRHEAQTLEQGMTRVLRLLDHAMVEVEPGEFAVDEPVGTVRRDRGVIGLRRLRLAGRARPPRRCRVPAAPVRTICSWADPTGEPGRPARGARRSQKFHPTRAGRPARRSQTAR